MLKKMLKDQLRKTGMVRSLEIENQNLNSQLKNLETENEDLVKENGILVEKLKNLENLENHTLSPDCVRGVSSDAGKAAVLKYILEHVKKDATILDVGFGSGIYGKILRAFDYQTIDGVDVYNKNIQEMGLDRIYEGIFVSNIVDFDFEHYDLIIFGDVLEHIELEAAKDLLSGYITDNKCEHIVVSIPYEYEQEEVYGNQYEKHLQPMANREFMEEHYPYLELVDEAIMPHNGGTIATYIWSRN